MKSESKSSAPATPDLLVTGASGHLGRRVVELLLESGHSAVIAGSRDPGKLTDLAARGVETRTVDFDRPETLAAAFAGVDRLLLVSTDAIMVPGQRLAQHQAAIAAAEKAGVRHIVYTSTVDAGPDSLLAVAPDHFGTEQALAASSLDHTILRNNYYADNLLPALPQAVRDGKWFTAAGSGAISYVTREDCAAAAAATLASEFTGRRTLQITGPRAWTADDLAAAIATATGSPVEAVHISLEDLTAGLLAHGLPEPIARLVASFDAAAATGALAPVTADYSTLTGRQPQTLPGFLATHHRRGDIPVPLV